VAAALGLTGEQKEKIRSLQAKAREERGGRQGGDRGEEGRKKREEARKGLNEQLLNVLTAEQKAKMKELTGEPFTGEIRWPQFGGRNRPGR
jgi:Spy/CpxP family protein refolding chaperone